MKTISHKKSLDVLEEAIIHFLVVGQIEIVAVLCELLLECDDKFVKPNGVSRESGSIPKREIRKIPEMQS